MAASNEPEPHAPVIQAEFSPTVTYDHQSMLVFWPSKVYSLHIATKFT